MRPLLVAILALAACGDEATTSLSVDLRTDFVGGRDFSGVQVFVGEGDIRERYEHNFSALVDYYRGARVATASSIETGLLNLEVVLLQDGVPLINRATTATVVPGTRNVVTVVITRDCTGVVCPSAAGNPLFESCLGGRCEDPRCTPETPEFCSAGECTSDAACTSTGCQRAQCVSNICLVGADDSQCAGGMLCDVDRGCIPAGADAGPVDASVDAGRDAEVDTGIDVPMDAGADSAPDVGPNVVDIDGDSYSLAAGYILDSPFALTPAETASLAGRIDAMAMPSAASAFGPGLYIGVAGDVMAPPAPFVARLSAGGFQLLAFTDGSTGPDEHMTNLAFSPPGGPYGDFLYVCSASVGSGDGVYRMDSGSNFSRFRVFNNCNGMAFDTASVMGDFGIMGPMYINVGSANFDRLGPDMNVDSLFSGLALAPEGYAIHIPQAGAFAGSVFLVGAGERDNADDGVVIRIASVAPFANDLPWLSALPDPGFNGAVFANGGALGDGLFITALNLGELRRYDGSGSFMTIVSGLSSPSALATDGDVLYIADNDRGRVLRLRPL